MSATVDDAAAKALGAHRPAVWALGYRMLGTVADADDLVQDTAVRLLERPPPDLERSLRPWLIRVATNLAKDRLRRRRRRAYDGPWLPAPLADVEELLAEEQSLWARDVVSPQAAVSRAESLRYAFMVALEALTPQQRAVLLLRDVFGLSTKEVERALDMGASNVKVTLHRARKALDGYGGDAAPGGAALDVVTSLLTCLAARDADGAAALLAADVLTTTDAGGRFAAARNRVQGRARVITLLLGLATKFGERMAIAPATVHGAPAVLVTDLHPGRPGAPVAPRQTLVFDVDSDGRVRNVWGQMIPEKLVAIG